MIDCFSINQLNNKVDKTLRHPASLKIFFATEMWERYGFYVVQTLLALYLAMHFKWEDARIYPLVGSFTALTYISPVIGGWIADHLLGQKRTTIIGAIVLFFSYLFLGFTDSNISHTSMLAGIAVGTGLLKPNISSLLGNEYPEGSPHRESGFTIFYMGINAGIMLGTTIPSFLNRHYGWSSAFLSASFGMVLALVVFVYGVYRYKIEDYRPFQYSLGKILTAIGMVIILWLGSFYILRYPTLANSIFGLVVFLSIGFIVSSIKQEPPAQARQTIIIGFLCLISVFFWSFYFQMFLSLTLFIARVVQPTIFGFPFPPPYYVAVQSLGIILFGILLSRHKKELDLTQRGTRIGNKFQLAMICMTITYAIITLVCNLNQGPELLSPLYFIPAYLLISLAELLLSPVGLAAITLLSCHKKVSTMMGIFFVSLGLGGFLSGKLAILTAIPAGEISVTALKAHYADAFIRLLCILGGATILSVLLNRAIKFMLLRTRT